VPARSVLALIGVLCVPYIAPSAADCPDAPRFRQGADRIAAPGRAGAAFAGAAAAPPGAAVAPRLARQLRRCPARPRLALLSMVGNGMGGMRDANGGGRKSGRQMASEGASETMSKCSEDEEDGEAMSMMSGTDIFRTDDKVRVFGASLDSKVASRGQGLQDYEEQEVPKEVMDRILLQTGGDMEAAKRLLRQRDAQIKEAERYFRTGVSLMERGRYKAAIEQIGKAITIVPGGASSREGGQYSM
jgi:hypothetical protein